MVVYFYSRDVVVASYANDFSKGYAESQMTLAGYLVDSINNIYFVKLFGQYFHEQQRLIRQHRYF